MLCSVHVTFSVSMAVVCLISTSQGALPAASSWSFMSGAFLISAKACSVVLVTKYSAHWLQLCYLAISMDLHLFKIIKIDITYYSENH